MEEISKLIHGQDAYYKLSPKNSGETSLNLSNELLQFIAPELEKGKEMKISFVINREDYLKALGYILSISPIYISSSTNSTKVDGDPSFFLKDFQSVCSFFGSDIDKTYTVNIFYRNDGRVYLNSLEDKESKFNLRHFLIEDNSVLIFKKDDDVIRISLSSGNPSHLVKEKAVNRFAKEVCSFFIKFDGFSKFIPVFATSQAGYIQLESNGVLLSRFLSTNISEPLKGKKWFEDIFEIDNKQYLLCSEWTERSNTSSVPSIENFEQIISSLYNDRFVIMKEEGYFVLKDTLSDGKTNQKEHFDKLPYKSLDPLQQIFYGAPGTGKSRGIKDKESLFDEVIRTTFHPDTDYSTFVGAYKPVVESVDVKVVPVVLNDGASFDKNNGTYKEKKITYKFVKQSFLKAYIAAWKGLKQGKKVLLDIEEINRGNCAQIFGDIFQLLDREVEGDMTGYSTYPIDADEDISKLLKEEFEDSDIDLAYIKDGSKLLLPPNLYIRATMNTSDQSLFPIDSAFKRRWDWEYVPINYSNTDWKIVLDDKEYSWVKFQQEINKRIKDATDGSEDKQMGDFFVNVKHKGGIIDSNLLLNKIVFYLWNDVCKDGEGDIFKILNDDKKAEEITFSEFFKGDSIKKLQQWMDFLGVKSGAGEQNDDTAQDKEDFESKKEEEE